MSQVPNTSPSNADYDVENSTGANVRGDLNNILDAILTMNSGGSGPSYAKAYTLWADTSAGTMKIRNAANNAWIELFQLDGTLTLENGSASTPALAFRDDLDTGIFSEADNEFDIATGGTARMKLSSTITVFNESGANTDFRIEGDSQTHLFFLDAGNDRIGIRQSSPQTALDINGNLTISDSIIHSGDTNTLIRFPSNDNIQFDVNGNERLRIDDSDFVTVKHATTAKLRIQNSTAATSQVCMVDMAPAGTASGVQLKCTSDEDFSSGPNRTAHFEVSIRKDGTFATRLNIDNAGNVSIGSTATGRKLSVVDTAGAILELTSNTATATSAVYLHEGSIGGTTNGGAIQYDGSNNCLKLSCGTTLTSEALRIRRDNQFVGIGQGSSYNPGAPLEVRNPVGTTPTTGNFELLYLCAQHNSARGLAIGTGRPTSGNQNDAGVFYNARDIESSVYSAQHVFQRGGNTVMVIGYAGTNNVGIGVTAPTAALDVATSSAVVAEFQATGGSGGYIGLFTGASGAAQGYIGRSGQLVSIGGSSENLAIRSENEIEFALNQAGGQVTVRAKITASGIETTNTIKVETAANLVNPLTIDDSINNNFSTNAAVFRKGATGEVGSISCTRSATTYNTSSDYRLKENAVTISDGITRLKTLIPRRFNWINDDTNTLVDGFFAHEVTAVPEAVKGTKDEIATEDIDGKNIKKGDPIYQQIDHSKLVPLLVAAVQELITKVETLEAA